MFNPIALRKAKTPLIFYLSECNKVKAKCQRLTEGPLLDKLDDK